MNIKPLEVNRDRSSGVFVITSNGKDWANVVAVAAEMSKNQDIDQIETEDGSYVCFGWRKTISWDEVRAVYADAKKSIK
jgi:hypothetical protein